MGYKSDIIAALQKEILPLQGYKPITNVQRMDIGLGPLLHAFPGSEFPLGVIHEFICEDQESIAASGGFVSAISSSLIKSGGVMVWISSSRKVFPPALTGFGIDPSHIIFVDLKKEKDLLWAMEETLKSPGLAAVVGELRELDFTSSRRMQLAVEQSRVTGFVLQCHPRKINTTASVTRWKIESIASSFDNNMPGVGFPRWNVELMKVRNGKPGKWQLEWVEGRFRPVYNLDSVEQQHHRKTG